MLHSIIKERFPPIKLFYEKNTHKKVQTDYYTAIPYGKKYFAWFTYYKNENVCVIIEIKVERDGKFSFVSSEEQYCMGHLCQKRDSFVLRIFSSIKTSV
jgi:hypothetical protein